MDRTLSLRGCRNLLGSTVSTILILVTRRMLASRDHAQVRSMNVSNVVVTRRRSDCGLRILAYSPYKWTEGARAGATSCLMSQAIAREFASASVRRQPTSSLKLLRCTTCQVWYAIKG